MPGTAAWWAIALVVVSAVPWPVCARPARCTTTQEGSYACDFKTTDKDGSFEISAPGMPLYSLVMDTPGKAFGFVNLGNRNISLPGEFVRSPADPACWVNDQTSDRLCAR